MPLCSYMAKVRDKASMLSDHLLLVFKKTAVRDTLKMSKDEIAGNLFNVCMTVLLLFSVPKYL